MRDGVILVDAGMPPGLMDELRTAVTVNAHFIVWDRSCDDVSALVTYPADGRIIHLLRERAAREDVLSLKDIVEWRRERAAERAACAPVVVRDTRKSAPVRVPGRVDRRFPPPRGALPARFGTYQGAF